MAQAASCVGMSYSLAWQLEVAEAEVILEVVVTGITEGNYVYLSK
jgi:molybdenum-dependent DNA-binding transcriptional regulator ModE